MKHLKVILYDEDTKTIIDHECIPDGEWVFSGGGNDTIFAEIFLRVDELIIGSSHYKIVSRHFAIDGAKLIIGVRLNK